MSDVPQRSNLLRLTDTTLRDGSHAMAHAFTRDDVHATVTALDQAGVPVIEITHGDGLGGSSFTYGFSAVDELELVGVGVQAARNAKIACLLLPGVGTAETMRKAAAAGASIVRIATHCTESDIAAQHFGLARELGLETVGFLMLSHMIDGEPLAHQARVMVDAGCECVYVVDSAGALVPQGVFQRVRALAEELGGNAQVGFHAHNNLGLAIANSLAAIDAGAVQIDGSMCGLGAGAGNAPTEVIVAVLKRIGIDTGIALDEILAAADEVVRPYMRRPPVLDRNSILMGYAGVYSSFLLHAERIGRRYGVPVQEILIEAGRRHYVGGQEDLLIDIALMLTTEEETGGVVAGA